MRSHLHGRVRNRLPRGLRRAIHAGIAVLLATGAGWLVAACLLAPPGDPVPAPHPWAGPLLAAHGIAAHVALVACALVGHAHVRAGWRMPPLRPAGAALVGALLALAATGLVFYYAADETVVGVTRWVHVLAGVALPGVLWLHIRRARRMAGDA